MDKDHPYITGYMCYTDWCYELGQAHDGNKVYPSIDALKYYKGCVSECGIVEIAVSLVKVVQSPKESET